MTVKTLVLLDLDRTSFKTDEHFKDFCTIISDHFGVDVNVLQEHQHRLTEKPSPYSPLDDIRYDTSVSVDPNEIRAYADVELKNNEKDYLYPDVEPFLKWHQKQGNEIVLITVGTHEYQTHKQSLSEALQQLPMIVTRQSKSKVINEHMQFIENSGVLLRYEGMNIEADRAMLIDDRAGTFKDTLPLPDDPRLDLIRVVRDGAAHSDSPTPANVREIHGLSELITN